MKPYQVKLLIFRGILAAITLSLVLVALFLVVVLVDNYLARRAFQNQNVSESFTLRGSVYVTTHPAMVRQSFAVHKGAREFRVFVLGSSEAMGTPYVHQNLSSLSGWLMNMPNEGGISTWLTKYLQQLLPGKQVSVINAAKGACDLASSVATLKQVMEFGAPDLIVVLDGNNERDFPQIWRDNLGKGVKLDTVLEYLTLKFEANIKTIVTLAEDHNVTTYVLTVPNNLRNWMPAGKMEGMSREEIENVMTRAPSERVKTLQTVATENVKSAVYHWHMAKALDFLGDFVAARDCYVRAKDLDYAFRRTRTSWNEAIRNIKSRFVPTIDMERIMFSYARDGIPGSDLFHDYCHMKLAANRIVAFEIAKRVRQDMGLTPSIALQDAVLEPFRARQIRRLYAIKAFKWTRATWFAKRDSVQDSNDEMTASQYMQEAAVIDEQTGLFESAK